VCASGRLFFLASIAISQALLHTTALGQLVLCYRLPPVGSSPCAAAAYYLPVRQRLRVTWAYSSSLEPVRVLSYVRVRARVPKFLSPAAKPLSRSIVPNGCPSTASSHSVPCRPLTVPDPRSPRRTVEVLCEHPAATACQTSNILVDGPPTAPLSTISVLVYIDPSGALYAVVLC
jgi:hypothetical protein